MASPPSSEAQFLDLDGCACAPREWTPLLLLLPGPITDWEGWSVAVNGEPRAVHLRRIAGQAQCVCEWPESSAGRYRIVLDHPARGRVEQDLLIMPAKLGEQAIERILEDMEKRLPHALAAALQRGGALAGLDLLPPENVTPAAELSRLRHIVAGTEAEPGLLRLLPLIASAPHKVLVETVINTPQERARRPHAVLMRKALYRGHQIDDEGRPLRLFDRRIEPSHDVHENRVVKLVCELSRQRLVRLIPMLPAALQSDTSSLLDALTRAVRQAAFLAEVGPSGTTVPQVTQVLLRRADYRRVLNLWKALCSGLAVRFGSGALDTPFRSVPNLYELWGTFASLTKIVELLVDHGFEIGRERLIRRLPQGPLVELVQGQNPLAHLTRGDSTTANVYFQRSFSAQSAPLASVSFDQRPDLVVEVARPDGPCALIVLDPKYKLDERSGMIGPKKEDIDKMHAYRDAIVHRSHGRVIRHAAILYPGPTRRFGDEVSALNADPLDPGVLGLAVRQLVNEIVLR